MLSVFLMWSTRRPGVETRMLMPLRSLRTGSKTGCPGSESSPAGTRTPTQQGPRPSRDRDPGMLPGFFSLPLLSSHQNSRHDPGERLQEDKQKCSKCSCCPTSSSEVHPNWRSSTAPSRDSSLTAAFTTFQSRLGADPLAMRPPAVEGDDHLTAFCPRLVHGGRRTPDRQV